MTPDPNIAPPMSERKKLMKKMNRGLYKGNNTQANQPICPSHKPPTMVNNKLKLV
jgi:hypothetical protein